MKNQRGARINSHFAGNWNTRPQDIYNAAKAKALSCLNNPNPKLTVLERAFYNAAKKGK